MVAHSSSSSSSSNNNNNNNNSNGNMRKGIFARTRRKIIVTAAALSIGLVLLSGAARLPACGAESDASSDSDSSAAAEVVCEVDGTCSNAVDADGVVVADSSAKQPATAVVVDDPCVNLNPSCTKWANEGECKNNPGYMLSSCPRACNVCPPMDISEKEREEMQAGVECVDLHDMCWKWAEEGECVVNPNYMSKACRDSCMLCLDLKAARERGDDEDYIRRKRIYVNLDIGKRQLIPPGLDEDEKYRTKSLLRAMDEYAKGYVLDATTPDEIRDRCKNAFGLCGHWAASGLCTERVVFMLNSCPMACKICDRTDQFHRCTGRRHPGEKAAFDKGGIERMFRGIKDGGEMKEKWDRYGPEFLTEPKPKVEGEGGLEKKEEGRADDPFLVRFAKFLTDDEVDRLIQIGNDIGWTESTVDEAEFGAGNPTGTVPRRNSDSSICRPGQPCESDPVYRTIVERISDLVGVSSEYIEAAELVRYGPRESYGVHHDYLVHDTWKPAGPRVLTFLLILTDMEEGGATGFPDLDWLFVKAKKGTALLWSNVKSDDPTEADRRLVHEGLPVVKGQKYAANFWVHQYNWRKAHERNCV